MLRRIDQRLVEDGASKREWYQSPLLDLFVWYDASGRIISFQLSYDKQRTEKLCLWKSGGRLACYEVEPGDNPGGYSRSPVLRQQVPCQLTPLHGVFADQSGHLPASLRQLIDDVLRTEIGRLE